MTLTTAQATTIRNAIQADSALMAFINASQHQPVADAMNTPSASGAWRKDAVVDDIQNAIDYTKYTPTDAPTDTTLVYSNRLLSVQTKQMNLQNMLLGRASFDATKTTNRSSLRDAVIALPTGASGASISAGGASGVTVLTACTRLATRAEALLFTSSPTTGTVTAGIMGWEGLLSASDIIEIMSV